jgi:hypothetical protein
MSDIIFSCECGMILKVKSGEQTGGLVDCPSCNASIRVPADREAEIAPPQLDPEFEPAMELESAGHENFAVIYITLISLLTIGAIAFFLVPALIGPKNKSPESVLASDSAREDSAPKHKNTSTKPRNQRADRTGARSDSKAPSGSASDPSEEPLPRYDDVPPSPSPSAPSTEPSSPPAPAPDPAPDTPSRDASAPSPGPMFNPDAPLSRSSGGDTPTKKSAGKGKSRTAAAPNPASVKLDEAKRLEWDGKKQEALAAFQAVVDQFPTSAEYNVARSRIEVLKKYLAPAKPRSTPQHGGITPRP